MGRHIFKHKKGTTLVEVVLYVALLLVFVVAMIDFSLNMIVDTAKLRTIQDVQHNARFTVSHLGRSISKSIVVNEELSLFGEMQGKLSLDMGENQEHLYFLESDRLYFQLNEDQPISLTPKNLRVEKLQFATVGQGDSQTIQIDLLIKHVNPSGKNEYHWRQPIQTSFLINSL